MGQSSSKYAEGRSDGSLTAAEDDEPGGIRSPRRLLPADSLDTEIIDRALYTQASRPPLDPGAGSGTPTKLVSRDIKSRNNTKPSAARAAALDSTASAIGSKLDNYLGRAPPPAVSKNPAVGKLTKPPSAVASLKDMRPHAPPRIVVQDLSGSPLYGPSPALNVGSLGSAGSLTSNSVSSGDSPMTSPESSDIEPGSPTSSASSAGSASSGSDSGSDSGSSASVRRSGTPGGSKSGPKSAFQSANLPKVNLPVNRFIKRICVAGIQRQKKFCLDQTEIKDICAAAQEVFLSQPVLLELGTPVKVVGDIHGQFKDLMRIFKMCGMPPATNYLFLGDYVDRGKQSLETIMLLLCLKLRFPNNVFLLRGNHECANVTKVYGFYDECKRRSSLKAWRSVVDVFNTLPIAATVGGKIFCVHGGLSPYLGSLADIERVSRPTDVPETGLVSDLLWSDPDAQVSEWSDSDRGVSFCFGKRVLDSFCHRFKFDLVARGHMVVEDGYEFFGNRKLVTIFSAPNYCGDFDNWGAVMSVDESLCCSFELLEPFSKQKC